MGSAPGRQPLWTPDPDHSQTTEMAGFMRWVAERHSVELADYNDLWRWSVDRLESFWADVWEFCDVRASKPYGRVLANRAMPGAVWFEGAELNYAENLLRRASSDREQTAVLHSSELRELRELSWGELAQQVAAAAAGLRELGVGRGDRVVAYMPNIPETLVAFLATASLGAIWSSAAPEFGARSVIDRFAQIEPKVLLAIGGYGYRDRYVDRRAEVQA
ncbi:MAG: AMP-binding protein, partial [Solirubrobacteraceae bacterium]